MQRILRRLAPLALLIAALALVACGGDDEGSAGGGGTPVEGEDPTAILEQTFSAEGDKTSDSGVLDLSMTVTATGGTSPLQNPIDVSVSGPFQSEGAGKVPSLDIDVSVTGIPGQDSIEAGLTSTGDKGFVNFMGTEYAVSDEIFQQFTAGFEQQEETPMSLSELGITPQNWLTNASNEGDSDVGGTETIKITGDVDLPAMLADVNTLLSQAGSLGIPNTGQLPTKLTDEQIRQVEEAVKEARVEIETGKEDSILRRFAFNLSAEDPAGSGGAVDIDFDLSLTELNEDQEISEPEDAQPFEDLIGQFGGLGGLGALGGAGAATGSAGSSSAATEEYTQCVEAAGDDLDKAQQCADLLVP